MGGVSGDPVKKEIAVSDPVVHLPHEDVGDARRNTGVEAVVIAADGCSVPGVPGGSAHLSEGLAAELADIRVRGVVHTIDQHLNLAHDDARSGGHVLQSDALDQIIHPDEWAVLGGAPTEDGSTAQPDGHSDKGPGV